MFFITMVTSSCSIRLVTLRRVYKQKTNNKHVNSQQRYTREKTNSFIVVCFKHSKQELLEVLELSRTELAVLCVGREEEWHKQWSLFTKTLQRPSECDLCSRWFFHRCTFVPVLGPAYSGLYGQVVLGPAYSGLYGQVVLGPAYSGLYRQVVLGPAYSGLYRQVVLGPAYSGLYRQVVLGPAYSGLCRQVVLGPAYSGLCRQVVLGPAYNGLYRQVVLGPAYSGLCRQVVLGPAYSGLYRQVVYNS